jgi:hypothetical protein
VTQPQPTAGPPDRLARSRGPLVAAVIVIAFIVVGAILAWVLFIRSDAPPEVGLSSSTPGASAIAASPSAAASSGGSAPSGSAVPSGAPTSSPASGSGGEGISGTWTVDPSIGSFSDFSGSFVGYRIDEQLAGIGANTAVGRTPNVTGSMTVDGTTVTVATFSRATTPDGTGSSVSRDWRPARIRPRHSRSRSPSSSARCRRTARSSRPRRPAT